jgi:hypothetical protein
LPIFLTVAYFYEHFRNGDPSDRKAEGWNSEWRYRLHRGCPYFVFDNGCEACYE